ncbi:MAG: hypothetical protein D6714_00345, partial [Bacteroidetes bacterium]
MFGQADTKLERGAVSYASTRQVYVKFPSTEAFNTGDTLFIEREGKLIPALVIVNKSSTSTVCSKLLDETFRAGTEIFARIPVKEAPKEEKKKPSGKDRDKDQPVTGNPVIVPEEEEPLYKQRIRGRVSAASYSNVHADGDRRDRMRYAFSFRGDHIGNSRFSVENQITFRHTLGEWNEVKANLGNALKVYNLSVNYDIDSTSSISIGRRINRKFSSIGAADGLQYEKYFGNFYAGIITGSRPDYSDYGFNLDLLQAGVYVGLMAPNPNKYGQTTLGFIEQRNKANTDRRFLYFQHSGELVKNLNLFSSFEVDMFENVNNVSNNKPRLTNFLVSLRYRASRKLRFSLSYDNRKNIIYYESYKNFIDQLIEDETRQGLRFGASFRPVRLISMGMTSSLRFQKSTANLSRNLNTYVNFSRIPTINARLSVRANFLQTNYIESRILGARMSKEIIRRKVNGEVYYRMVDYFYKTSDSKVHQNIVGGSLSWRMMGKLSLY